MSSCVVCDSRSANNVVLAGVRCTGRKLFLKMCEGCYTKSSVRFRVCNFCGVADDDMYVVYNDDEYRRIRCCAPCVADMRKKIGLSSHDIVNELIEVDGEAE